MSVYFIRVGRYFKIGTSEDPELRFKRLFNGSTNYAAPWDCSRRLADRTLVGFVPGGRSEEHAAHKALENFGVGCEFFLAEPLVIDYVQRSLIGRRVIRSKVIRQEGPAESVGQVMPGSRDADEAIYAGLHAGMSSARCVTLARRAS